MQPASGLSNHTNRQGNESINVNETETERILQSNDKVTVKDLWNAAPKPDFPPFFLELLDLDVMLTETAEKADNLKEKIDRRRSADKKL